MRTHCSEMHDTRQKHDVLHIVDPSPLFLWLFDRMAQFPFIFFRRGRDMENAYAKPLGKAAKQNIEVANLRHFATDMIKSQLESRTQSYWESEGGPHYCPRLETMYFAWTNGLRWSTDICQLKFETVVTNATLLPIRKLVIFSPAY